MTTTARVLAVLLAATLARAGVAQGFRDVEIVTTKISDSLFMLEGRGGNIGVCAGPDGVFMIDDQYAPLTGKITAAIAEISDRPIRFVINTHWHGDHTGGNENLGSAGAIIVAHENVRKRLSTDQFIEAFGREIKAAPPAAWPAITFREDVTFHLNGHEIHVFHVRGAHTDGDSIVHFREANVVHMGDVFFWEMYPFIDASSGGSIDGVIAAVDLVLERTDDRTKIIPGHGKLTDAAGLRVYRRMLVTVRDRVREHLDAGRTVEEIVAAKPTADFDATWGNGFLQPDQWVGIVCGAMRK